MSPGLRNSSNYHGGTGETLELCVGWKRAFRVENHVRAPCIWKGGQVQAVCFAKLERSEDSAKV